MRIIGYLYPLWVYHIGVRAATPRGTPGSQPPHPLDVGPRSTFALPTLARMTDSTRPELPAEAALRTAWLVVAILVGPTLIVAVLADGLGSFGSENSNPWAGPLTVACCIVSIVCGLAAFAFEAPWWSALLIASPGFTWLATSLTQDIVWSIAMVLSPLAALGGAVSGFIISVATAAGDEGSADE